MANYVPLDSTFSQALGTIGFNTDQPADLGPSLIFIFKLGIMICVLAAGIMYMWAGFVRLKASEQAIRKSNEIMKRATYGLVGVLSLVIIGLTINKDILNIDVPLKSLRANSPVGGVLGSPAQSQGLQSPSGQSASCSDPTALANSLKNGGSVCANTSCTALTGCNYQQYLPLIQSQAQAAGVDTAVVIALMCKESKAVANASHQNPDGTYDCGLMQINQTGGCSTAILDPATNITKGIQKIKASLSNVQVYQNIAPELGAFASYNCCSNGTSPAAVSADCTQAAGFPYAIPKWACPINPGSGTFNMCAVKAYACDVEACVQQLNL